VRCEPPKTAAATAADREIVIGAVSGNCEKEFGISVEAEFTGT
jgi:hypothetical protein